MREGCNEQRKYLVEANEDATEKLKALGVQFHDIDITELQTRYRKEAEAEGFQFDPEWQKAVDEAVKEAETM